jgi:DNA-binding LytR/AlgR family response regulator
MKILIVEEEIATLAFIQKILQTYGQDTHVPYYASNLLEGIQKIRLYSPNLLLIDLDSDKKNWSQMIDFLEKKKLSHNLVTILIGSTLHAEILKSSLYLNPIALLDKPLEEPKLINALHLAHQKTKENAILSTILDTKIPLDRLLRNIENITSTLCIKLINGDFENIHLEECLYFHLECSVLRIKFKNEVIKNLAQSLSSIEENLPKERFFRISKQTIINKAFIRAYFPKPRILTMQDGNQFGVSRRKGKEFVLFLNSQIP